MKLTNMYYHDQRQHHEALYPHSQAEGRMSDQDEGASREDANFRSDTLRTPENATPQHPITLTTHSEQITPRILLPLNRLKQALEVPRPKPIKVVPLDNLNKHRRPIHQMLRKQLQQVTPLVEVNQDVQSLEHLEVLIQRQPALLQPHLHTIIVCARHLDKLDTACLEIRNRRHDIIRPQCNMLYPRTAVEIHVFLDLALLLPLGGLVDRHLDDFVWTRHDDRFERRVLCANVVVVDAPEAVESEHFFVVFACVFHFVPVLVADAVVDGFEVDAGEEAG